MGWFKKLFGKKDQQPENEPSQNEEPTLPESEDSSLPRESEEMKNQPSVDEETRREEE